MSDMKTREPKFVEGDVVAFSRTDRGVFRVDGNVADAFGRIHVAISAITDGGRLIPAGCVPQGKLVKREEPSRP